MNFRLRQERNAFVFLVVVVTPLVLLTAPLPYLLSPSAKSDAFAGADRNRDGFIDAQESAAIPGLLPIFSLVDANGDGRIDRDELTRVRPARARLASR
jgi:hypothetical protein